MKYFLFLSKVISLVAPSCALDLASQTEALAMESEATAASLIVLINAFPLASQEKRS